MNDTKKLCWMPQTHHPLCRCYRGMHVLLKDSDEAKRIDAKEKSAEVKSAE